MKKNYTIVFAVIVALIVLCAFWGCDSGGDDDSGSPSVSNPIGNAADLAKIGTPGYPLDGTYTLTADVTLPADWTPIGTGTQPFTGTFDGGGYSITIGSTTASSIAVRGFSSGVDISSGLDFASDWGFTGGIIARGLFAYTENATIKDMNIAISPGSSFVITSTATDQMQLFGTVAAAAVNTAFTNINISGGELDVDASAADELYVGGIAGMIVEGSMTRCAMTGDVQVASGTANNSIGGLVGEAYGSFLVNSSASGNVRVESTAAGSDYVSAGGLVGKLDNSEDGSSAVIRKSYSTGTVSAVSTVGRARAGGIASRIRGSAEITDCYSTGNISASGGYSAEAGGIAGEAHANGNVTIAIAHCYALGNVSGGAESGGGIVGNVQEGTSHEDGPIIGSGSISGCAALSGLVAGSSLSANRIVGSVSSGGPFSLNNNIAYDGMLVNTSTVSSIDDTDLNGADKTSAELANQATYKAIGWDFDTVWKMEGGRPVLQWQ
ncbi:MAG: hypothetical protein LBK13_00780 [Spirochaetales bacterium]|nr:hypothetical protein [Spirochaetales bacterium]